MILKYYVNQDLLFNDFLHLLHLPKKLISPILSQNLVKLNNQIQPYFKDLHSGDVITITLPEESVDNTIDHEDILLDIIFEDEYLLIVNKPSGMPVMVTKSHPLRTLSNALCHYYVKNNIKSKIHLVNRLDKDTSGLMIVAKNRYIKYLLSENLKHKITREYYCIVEGLLKNKIGLIDFSIGKANADSMIRIVKQDGLTALTEYEVLQEWNQYSLLKVKLQTGRTHQIRVHLSYIGHPIVGDSLYNSNKSEQTTMMLCSHFVQFIHPITNKLIEFDIGIPNSFHQFSNQIKKG